MILEQINEWGEVTSRQVPKRRPVERSQPLAVGEQASFFSLVEQEGYWLTSANPINVSNQVLTLFHLLRKGPVVIGFYCPCWGRYASPFLDRLIHLAQSIPKAGAQLIVFTNEHPRYLPRHAKQAGITFVFDEQKDIARRFGVYSETDPIWDRVSGISEEVYIPALYVVGKSGQLSYRFLDEQFEGFVNPVPLYNALFQ